MVKFIIEDSFQITGRGTVITGKVVEGHFTQEEDLIYLDNFQLQIKSIEQFRKMFNSQLGDNFGIVLGDQISKDDVIKYRGKEVFIYSRVDIRERKLNDLGI